MRPFATVLSAFLLAFSAAPLSAQAPSAIDPDRGPAVSLAATGGGTVGVWFAAGERTDLGLEAGYSLTRLEGDTRAQGASLGMSLRRFLPLDDETAFVPYLQAGILTDYGRQRTPGLTFGPQTRSTLGIGGQVAVGAEWFPAPRLSIGGHVGVRARRARERLRQEGDPPPPTTSSSMHTVNTVTSGVQLRLFLR